MDPDPNSDNVVAPPKSDIKLYHPCECVMTHTWMSHVTNMQVSDVTYINEACLRPQFWHRQGSANQDIVCKHTKKIDGIDVNSGRAWQIYTCVPVCTRTNMLDTMQTHQAEAHQQVWRRRLGWAGRCPSWCHGARSSGDAGTPVLQHDIYRCI